MSEMDIQHLDLSQLDQVLTAASRAAEDLRSAGATLQETGDDREESIKKFEDAKAALEQRVTIVQEEAMDTEIRVVQEENKEHDRRKEEMAALKDLRELEKQIEEKEELARRKEYELSMALTDGYYDDQGVYTYDVKESDLIDNGDGTYSVALNKENMDGNEVVNLNNTTDKEISSVVLWDEGERSTQKVNQADNGKLTIDINNSTPDKIQLSDITEEKTSNVVVDHGQTIDMPTIDRAETTPVEANQDLKTITTNTPVPNEVTNNEEVNTNPAQKDDQIMKNFSNSVGGSYEEHDKSKNPDSQTLPDKSGKSENLDNILGL